jgi:VanZ family protein
VCQKAIKFLICSDDTQWALLEYHKNKKRHEHFGKWIAHRWKHFVFQNALQVVSFHTLEAIVRAKYEFG